MASTAEEQKLAAEAIRNADHEVDLAFGTALQQTQLHPAVDDSETRELNTRIRTLDSRLQELQEEVSRLTKLAANPGKNDSHAIQQQLEIAQARATLSAYSGLANLSILSVFTCFQELIVFFPSVNC